jgi:hypothetical protein
MHDIDRTTMEFGQEMGFEGEQFEYNEGEFGEGESLNEQMEAEFAHELLSVSNEQELDRFLGDFIKKVGSVAGKVIRSPVGKAVGGVLKGVAKKALPLAGGAIGGYFGGPLGARIGSGLASAAGGALGLEGEWEGENQEYEGARKFVRIASDTVRKASRAPQGADPRQVAQSAALQAARKHAPGLLQQRGGRQGQGGGQSSMGACPSGGSMGGGFSNSSPSAQGYGGGSGGQSGRWSRQGNNIVLHGA